MKKFILPDLPRLVSGGQYSATIMRSVSLLAALFPIMNGSLGHAQDAASVPAFEVASIKLNNSEDGMVLRLYPGGAA